MHANIRSVNHKVGSGVERLFPSVSSIGLLLIHSLDEHFVKELLSSRHCAQSLRQKGITLRLVPKELIVWWGHQAGVYMMISQQSALSLVIASCHSGTRGSA